MKNTDIFNINDKYLLWLKQMDLMSFEKLMFADIGSKVNKRVRRIEGCGKVVYLKRQLNTSIYKSIEKYLQCMYPHSRPFSEYIHICCLQKAQLPVMNPIAAGERRICGLPRCGFILVEEVKGISLEECLKQNITTVQKNALLEAFGRLIAKLHQNGFYAALRLKDVIVTDVNEASLVIIDREVRCARPRLGWKLKANRSLRKSFRRIKTTFPEFDKHYINTILEAYNSCC
jgi:hypothetical protein